MFKPFATAAALGLAASPALSATIAETSGFFTLEAVGDVPAGISITALDPVLGRDAEADGPLAFAESFSDGFTTPDTTQADFGDLSASASADTTAAGKPGTAFGEAFVDLALFVENTTDEVLTITGLLKYDLSASVSIDGAADDAFAGAFLDFVIPVAGGSVFTQEVFADLGSPTGAATGEFEIPLTLPGNFGADVFLTSDATAFAADRLAC